MISSPPWGNNKFLYIDVLIVKPPFNSADETAGLGEWKIPNKISLRANRNV